MDSTGKFWIITWSMTFATVLILACLIYNGLEASRPYDARVRIECIHAGGEWGPARGSTSEYTCIPK